MTMTKAVAVACLLAFAAHASAYFDASPTLGRLVREATNVVVLRVDKVSREKRAIVYTKVADLKGTHAGEQVKHQLTDGWQPGEARLVLDRAEPGRVAVFFYS